MKVLSDLLHFVDCIGDTLVPMATVRAESGGEGITTMVDSSFAFVYLEMLCQVHNCLCVGAAFAFQGLAVER